MSEVESVEHETVTCWTLLCLPGSVLIDDVYEHDSDFISEVRRSLTERGFAAV